MSDDEPDLDNDDPQPTSKDLRQRLAEQTRAADEAQRELTALRSREMFRDAGIDPNNKLHAAVMGGYDGPLEPAAIKSYVTDLGLDAPHPPSASDATPPPPNAELEALQRIGQAAGIEGLAPERHQEIDRQMTELSDKARRENWTPQQYQVQMAALAEQRGAVSWQGPLGPIEPFRR